MTFAGWTGDIWDALCEAIADTIRERADEIPTLTGLRTPTVYPYIQSRAISANIVMVDFAGAERGYDERMEAVDVEIQYLFRETIKIEVADVAVRRAAERILDIVEDDNLNYLADGGWVYRGTARVAAGIIADIDYYENENAKRYEGVVIYMTFSRGM